MVLAALLALLMTAGPRAAARPGSVGPILECASQLHDLYMGPHHYSLEEDYDKNTPPGKNTTVSISLFINRVSAVEENKEEITLDVFLQVYWEDSRLKTNSTFVEMPWEQRQLLWMPDLYIKQLQDMRIMSVFQEMTSVRLYHNGTIRVSIGATIVIKCDMDFVLYPLDVQRCDVDFSSYKYTTKDVTFQWRQATADFSSSEEGRKEFRLPKYVVKFATDTSKQIIHFGEGEHSSARLRITLSRELRSYLLESYLPSSLFVVMSWGSFCVIPEIVPGRMVLLVTTLLSLVTMFDTVRPIEVVSLIEITSVIFIITINWYDEKCLQYLECDRLKIGKPSPQNLNKNDALELKCIEVWLISCTIFVFLALLEYFVVLFGIRFDKSWRSRPRPQPQPAPLTNHAQPPPGSPAPATAGGGVFTAQISSEDSEAFKQQINAQTIQRDPPGLEYQESAEVPSGVFGRVKAAAQRAVLFCGAQKGTLDLYALMIFPLCFIVFAIVYWCTYVTESIRRIEGRS